MSIITSLLSLMEQAMIYYLARSFICVLRAAQYGALMLIENKQVYFIFHKSVACHCTTRACLIEFYSHKRLVRPCKL